MVLSLKESRAVADIAELLYNFLPGSGHAAWKGHVSYRTVAEQVGVGDYWQPGSKLPMITALLTRTLEHRHGLFEPLILEIVRAGIVYRQKQGTPIRAEEIDKLNGLILEVGFRFPDLWDEDFRTSLGLDGDARARAQVDRALTDERLRATERSKRSAELAELKQRFFSLHNKPDRERAGFELERILNRLFEVHSLQPREPFRIRGEQIDGSFQLDYEIYLVEAKWTAEPRPEADLLVFRGKIEGKSAFTRGVFISISGVSSEATHAITQGKQPNFFVMNGYDLTMLLEDNVSLTEFLRKRVRLLAEKDVSSYRTPNSASDSVRLPRDLHPRRPTSSRLRLAGAGKCQSQQRWTLRWANRPSCQGRLRGTAEKAGAVQENARMG